MLQGAPNIPGQEWQGRESPVIHCIDQGGLLSTQRILRVTGKIQEATQPVTVLDGSGTILGRRHLPTQSDNMALAERRETVGIEAAEEMAKTDRLAASTGLFQPKGNIGLDLLLFQSIFGPIGKPAEDAVYPAVSTTDGKPMNAQHDCVIRMSKDEMPPAEAFWSFTLYDTENGFFTPNERKRSGTPGPQRRRERGYGLAAGQEVPETSRGACRR
ncbi:MAG: DUF1214 domain-containing protein [Lysobacterales bacterium]|jgi:hypothetical protein